MTQTGSKPTVRNCDGCTLCCKVIGIKALEKPQGQWCQHCASGEGCKIYSSKPEECTTFVCGYLCEPELDERWKPSRSKIILVTEMGGKRIVAHMDTQRPDAWKQEPFFSTLKRWAQNGRTSGGEVLIDIGGRRTRLSPD